MKIIHSDFRKGTAKVKVENPEDLWCLSNIIDPGDLVRGKTIRKIKLGEKDQRSMKVIKKPVTIAISVEKADFSKTSPLLRISGIVSESPEDVPKGSHHTFNIEQDSIITIIKEKWLSFQIDKLKESASKEFAKILICILDREEALFALLKRYGYTLLSHIKGTVTKKAVEEAVKGSFYLEAIRKLEDYDKKYSLNQIIIASPAFWKEELMKELKNQDIKKKIILATCSSVDKTAVNEVLKRPETREALKQARASKEANVVEELLTEISKEGMAVYGLKQTAEAANAGAVKTLIITDNLIQKSREQNKYAQLDAIMKTTESTKGAVNIISSENDAGKKLDGLGGIGAVLKYKLNY
jgi:protein pelota